MVPRLSRLAGVLAFSLVWPAMLLGQVERITLPRGLCELSVSAPDGSDVSWEARQPASLDHRIYSLADGRNVVVFVLAKESVLVSDVIDWDARKRTKKTWIVSLDNPDPDPGPDPGPGPDPDPDLEGFAAEVFRRKSLIDDGPNALRLAEVFRDVASQANELGSVVVVAELTAGIKLLGLPNEGQPVLDWLSAELTDRAQSRPEIVSVYAEIAEGLSR